MTNTLFDLTLSLARTLGILRISKATGGSTTTIIDTSRRENNDYFNDGTAWIITDAGGAGAAPEKEFKRVSDYVSTSHTITVESAFTAAVASGDRYGIATGNLTLDNMVNAINSVLGDLYVPLVDTSITTAASQTEYSLPAGITRNNLMQVYIQTNDDSDDNQWSVITNFGVQPGTTGNVDTLILPIGLTDGYTIKLVYVSVHPALYDADDKLNEHIHISRVVYGAAANCMLMSGQNDFGDRTMIVRMNEYLRKAQMAELNHPISLPQRHGKITVIRTETIHYPGDSSVVS